MAAYAELWYSSAWPQKVSVLSRLGPTSEPRRSPDPLPSGLRKHLGLMGLTVEPRPPLVIS
ncbi:hypothetical protein Celaphus_00010617 [Cervus elaphus hippelaphus]|uniref:Uncharacterized protein n=1 Tax=Cervus elaphus hippelaphus TaxID=46360 RepID=A0A212C949_CEREH|nr:hypothetical protein Celaphus_00010617 [Cervus elaphus hippelaphus]